MKNIYTYHEHIGSVSTSYDEHVEIDVHTVQDKVNLEISDTEFEMVNATSYMNVEETKKLIAHLQKAVDSLEGGAFHESSSE